MPAKLLADGGQRRLHGGAVFGDRKVDRRLIGEGHGHGLPRGADILVCRNIYGRQECLPHVIRRIRQERVWRDIFDKPCAEERVI